LSSAAFYIFHAAQPLAVALLAAYQFRFFRVHCEEIFTTETQRGRAATKGSPRRTHRRGTEVAEFGVLLDKFLFSAHSASPR